MKRSKQANFASIPREIAMEIMLLLPFESIIACTLVSKEWFNLINDPKFFNHYNNKPLAFFVFLKTQTYFALLRDDKNTVTINSNSYHEPLFTKCNNNLLEIVTGRGKYYGPIASSVMLASNGMVCWEMENRRFVIYNLYNRGYYHEVKDAPLHKCRWYRAGRLIETWICRGYGYDSRDDDYKLMVVCDYEAGARFKALKGVYIGINKVQKKDNGKFWVYSLRTRVWEQFNGFPYAKYGWGKITTSDNRVGFSFKGALHWVVTRGKRECDPSNISDIIVTYDLYTRGFGEISAPKGCSSMQTSNLTEFGGNLCCWIFRDEDFGVWVMKEYAIQESWMKLFSIKSSITYSILFKPDVELTTIYEGQDGRKVALFVNRPTGTLYWYDIDNGNLESTSTKNPYDIDNGNPESICKNSIWLYGHWRRQWRKTRNEGRKSLFIHHFK